MLNYPIKTSDIESLYNIVELNNTSGYYPVGKNNKWHSGIHFETSAPINVIQRGTIIAYRISKNFQKKGKPEYISEETYLLLSGDNKKCYQQDVKEISGVRICLYKLNPSLPENEKNYLFSNNFVLIKNEIESSDLVEKIPIYSLYMNLLPDSENPLSELNEYKSISSEIINAKPFYRTWKFKINNQYNSTDVIYRLNNTFNAYSGTTFISSFRKVIKVTEMKNWMDILCCRLLLSNSTIKIPKKVVKPTSITFTIKNKEGRKVYKTQNEDFVGYLKEDKSLVITGEDCKKILTYTRGDCFISINVGSKDIEDFTPRKCWIASSFISADCYKKVYSNPEIYSLQRNPQKSELPFELNEDNLPVKKSPSNRAKDISACEYDAFIRRNVSADKIMSPYIPVETYLQESIKPKRINLKNAEIVITEIKGEIEYSDNNRSCFTKETGIIKYYEHKSSEDGEPVGLMTSTDEFYVESGEDDIINNKIVSPLIININNKKYKIKYTGSPHDVFLVKSELKSGVSDSIKTCEIPVTEDTCLGYPGKDKNGKKSYFDFAVILEKSLYEYKQKDSNEKKYLIDIPNDITFYKKEIKKYNVYEQYLPGSTAYKIIETDTFGDEVAKKIQINKIRIWLRNVDIKKDISTESCQITSQLSGYWLNSTYGNYTRDRKTDTKTSWLTEQLESLRTEFIENVVEYTMLQKNENETKIELDLTKYSKKIQFWVKDDSFFSQEEGVTVGEKVISFYLENPITKTVTNVDYSIDLKKISKIDNENILDFSNQKGLCKLVGTDFFIKKEDVVNCQHEAFDWKYYFTEITENASEKEGKGTAADIFCNRAEVISQIDVDDEQSDIPGWQYRKKDNQITQEELDQVYQNNEVSNKIRANLRKLMCKHPIEWNSKIYDNIKDDYEKATGCQLQNEQELKDEANATDIWNGLTPLNNIADGNGCLWFVHPLYFFNHLDRTGAWGFNPYAGMTIRPRFAEDGDPNIVVTSNPGFAPAVKDNSAGWIKERFPDNLKKKFNNIDLCWATVNYDYGNTKGYGGNHTGIDFAGLEGTEIYSLIEGEVIATTYQSSIENTYDKGIHCYGRMMLVLGYNNKLYLLGHLSKFLKKVGQKVYIGDPVACVGNTGYSKGAHLHLEVFVFSEQKEYEKILFCAEGEDINNHVNNSLHTTDGGTGVGDENDLRWADSFNNTRGNERKHPLSH